MFISSCIAFILESIPTFDLGYSTHGHGEALIVYLKAFLTALGSMGSTVSSPLPPVPKKIKKEIRDKYEFPRRHPLCLSLFKYPRVEQRKTPPNL